MAKHPIRIGIIGAGQVTRERLIPGFKAIDGVQLVGVCNRRRETASRVARDFEIPRIFSSWEDLVGDDGIDAVYVGAWPNLHCPVTLAAFDAGKHILTQARMALNAREAQRMLDRSRECPNLTAMIVPSPYGLSGDPYMRSLLEDGFLGELRELHVHGLSGDLADRKMPMGWRQMTRYSGFNMLTLGILHETVLRWVSPASEVYAVASKFIPRRIDPELEKPARVGTPDSVHILTTQEDSSRGVYRVSGVVWHDHSTGVALYGSKGTLIYDLKNDEIWGGRIHDTGLRKMPIPDDLRGGWNCEKEFIGAIRGECQVTRTNFETGVRYMQFTEAAARSSRHQIPVSLPLTEFSNPSL